MHPVPRQVLMSPAEQAADSMVTSAEDGRMRSGGGRVEEGINERDTTSRVLSMHLQITAPPTPFDMCPK